MPFEDLPADWQAYFLQLEKSVEESGRRAVELKDLLATYQVATWVLAVLAVILAVTLVIVYRKRRGVREALRDLTLHTAEDKRFANEERATLLRQRGELEERTGDLEQQLREARQTIEDLQRDDPTLVPAEHAEDRAPHVVIDHRDREEAYRRLQDENLRLRNVFRYHRTVTLVAAQTGKVDEALAHGIIRDGNTAYVCDPPIAANLGREGVVVAGKEGKTGVVRFQLSFRGDKLVDIRYVTPDTVSTV